MGTAWLGLAGAIVGGLVSLTGTIIASQFQWRQERVRWNEQRERDLLQWEQQRESDAEKWENERQRDGSEWERNRDDEQFRWLREQKFRYYLEVLDHLRAAGELASSALPAQEDEQRPYAREDEMAIVQELRNGYQGINSVTAVCGKSVIAQVNELSRDLYFTIQVVTYEGIKPGKMVRRPPGSKLSEWILSEVIDTMSARLSETLRKDLGAG